MTDLSHYTSIELFDACADRTVTPEAAAEELHRRHLLARERRFRQGVCAVLAVGIVVFGSVSAACVIYAAARVVLGALGVS